jgi:hypothetical protein
MDSGVAQRVALPTKIGSVFKLFSPSHAQAHTSPKKNASKKKKLLKRRKKSLIAQSHESSFQGSNMWLCGAALGASVKNHGTGEKKKKGQEFSHLLIRGQDEQALLIEGMEHCGELCGVELGDIRVGELRIGEIRKCGVGQRRAELREQRHLHCHGKAHGGDAGEGMGQALAGRGAGCELLRLGD